ncbi:uncharacterized protein LOC144622677 isoform X2 [Crassostrea virginica]
MCGYNEKHNGSQCIGCGDGYYGKDCSQQCGNNVYGPACGKTCNCTTDQRCDHVIGCIADFNNSSNFTVRRGDVLSTTTKDVEVSIVPSSGNLFSSNLQISAIGGITALFLLILIVKSFVKLHLKRKERTAKMSNKAEPEQEEGIYHVVNSEGNETNENQQLRKYYQLKQSNSVPSEPNENRGNYLHYHEIEVTCNSSNKSDSSDINVTSNINEQHNYLDVLGSSTSKESVVDDEHLVNLISQDDEDSSTQYTDTVNKSKSGAQENRYNTGSDYSGNATYLDVTNETVV